MKSENDVNVIKLVIFDLDGVLIQEKRDFTLDQILTPLKKFVSEIFEYGIQFAIISGRSNDEVTNFFEVYKVKLIDAEKIIKDLGIKFEEVFFMGDDILDIPLLQKVGFSAAPRNARREVKRVVKKIIPAEDVESMLNEIKSIVITS